MMNALAAVTRAAPSSAPRKRPGTSARSIEVRPSPMTASPSGRRRATRCFVEKGTRPHIIRPEGRQGAAVRCDGGGPAAVGSARRGAAVIFARYRPTIRGRRAQPFLVPAARGHDRATRARDRGHRGPLEPGGLVAPTRCWGLRRCRPARLSPQPLTGHRNWRSVVRTNLHDLLRVLRGCQPRRPAGPRTRCARRSSGRCLRPTSGT